MATFLAIFLGIWLDILLGTRLLGCVTETDVAGVCVKCENDLFVCRVEWTRGTAGRTKSIVANNLYYGTPGWGFNDHVLSLHRIFHLLGVEKRVCLLDTCMSLS